MLKDNSADLIKEIFVNRVYLNGNIFWWSSNLSVDTIMEDISKTQTNKNMKIMYLIICNIKILICFMIFIIFKVISIVSTAIISFKKLSIYWRIQYSIIIKNYKK